MNITSETPALISFIAGVNAKKEAHRIEQGFTYATKFGCELQSIGKKYARLASFEIHAGSGARTAGGVYCFIDFTTGDVLKAAGWKTPAKGIRGNLFAEDNGLSRCNHYGPAYNN